MRPLIIAAWLWLWTTIACGGEAVVAVASNFLEPARALAAVYTAASGHQLNVTGGSTGGLYAQIVNGAPFDIFLAANDREPTRLTEQGLAVPESRYTYAIGSLVLWSADPARIKDDCAAALKAGRYRHLAIANPAIAPYGEAATTLLGYLGLMPSVKSKLLMGENVSQAFQYALTGNAELALIARAQVVRLPQDRTGSSCVVNPALYPPLRQQAVLLLRGAGNPAAEEFMNFLKGPSAAALIHEFGYERDAPFNGSPPAKDQPSSHGHG